ncbi:MAG TPA: hypothetical protein VH062_03330 [Polyangiaceae bacterium]|nr:hypothetical protein [Polyangiaceae bacterium]
MNRRLHALFASVVLLAGCDATVTSVGAYDRGVQAQDTGVDARVPVRVTAHMDAGLPLDAARPPDAAFHGSSAGFYVEAEDGVLTAGIERASDAAASGGEYVVTAAGLQSSDVPGAARATYRVQLDAAGTYVVWTRVHSPDVARNAFWYRMDDGTWFVSRLSTGEDWYWGPLHESVDYNHPVQFELAAGEHVLSVANFIDGVGLDRLYFTTGTERPSGDDTSCRPPDSVKLGGVCVQSCGSQGGTTCGDQVCAGRTPIPAYDCAVCCIAP